MTAGGEVAKILPHPSVIILSFVEKGKGLSIGYPITDLLVEMVM